ncbi:hypothetical protein [Tropicibacter sp. S64]|uniref:hypothetical protein n=1 Tax=Tropicibacter sp. S64 TaxID=3415122 RepID=UPI003C7B2806
MDRKTRQELQDALKALPADAPTRLILQAETGAAPASDPPQPHQFDTREDFRRALIDHDMSADDPGFDALLDRLHALGLRTQVARQSNTVLVEGDPMRLHGALEVDGIEDAAFDKALDLIRPLKPKADK